jgi:hypothetical protein
MDPQRATRLGRFRQTPVKSARQRRGQFVVAIDFDDTLLDHETGEVHPEAGIFVRQLIEAGARIVIFTCRARPDHPKESYKEMVALLNAARIPYDEITALKPYSDLYIDDRAVRFDGSFDSIATECLAHAYAVKRGVR